MGDVIINKKLYICLRFILYNYKRSLCFYSRRSYGSRPLSPRGWKAAERLPLTAKCFAEIVTEGKVANNRGNICIYQKFVVPLQRILKGESFSFCSCILVRVMSDKAYIRHILSIYSAYIGIRWNGQNRSCIEAEAGDDIALKETKSYPLIKIAGTGHSPEHRRANEKAG